FVSFIVRVSSGPTTQNARMAPPRSTSSPMLANKKPTSLRKARMESPCDVSVRTREPSDEIRLLMSTRLPDGKEGPPGDLPHSHPGKRITARCGKPPPATTAAPATLPRRAWPTSVVLQRNQALAHPTR